MPLSKEKHGSPASGRVLVVAFDGATWNLAKPWMQSGHMPNLAQLVGEGVQAELHAELPPSSVPNWPAFATGTNAGKHGCLWWLQRDSAGWLNKVPIDANSIAGDTLWSYLSSNGKKVIVQNVPVTYPPPKINGVLISGLLTPRNANDFIYPPNLKPDIDREVDGYRIYPEGGYAKGLEEAFLRSLISNIQQHVKAADFLLRTQQWDFFIIVIGPTDEGAHKYWHYMDPTHRLHSSVENSGFGDSLQRLYEAADEALGTIARYAGPEDTLIVMSDHGFGPLERFFLPNNWLLRSGYLRLKRSPTTLFRRMLYGFKLTPSALYPIGKQLLSFIPGANRFRQRLDPIRQGGKSPLRKLFLSDADVDWSRTRVVATGFLCSQMFINLQGREPLGIVTDDDFELLRSRLIAELSDLTDPATGKRHYARIYRREELYSGPQLGQLPDLVCVPADYRVADAGMDFRANTLFADDAAITGTHRREGIFAMRGPGIRQGQISSPIRIYDLAPTIIHRLGLPVPKDMDGEVILEAFDQSFPGSREVRYTSAREPSTPETSGYEAEDAESIEDRLRDLGYLG